MRATSEGKAATRSLSQNGSALAQEIVKRVKPLSVQKVILFGSHAWGQPDPDSDLDVLVVLNDSSMPQTSKEHGALHLCVARRIRDVREKAPVDLIVHTQPMHRKFMGTDSMFARKVMNQGVVVYEESD